MLIRTAATSATDPDAAAAALAEALECRRLGRPDFVALHFDAGRDPDALRRAATALIGARRLHGGTSCLGVMTQDGAAIGEGGAVGAFAIWDAGGAYGVGAADLGDDPRAAGRAAAVAALASAGREGEQPDLVWLTAAPGSEEAVLEGVGEAMGEDVPVLGGSAADDDVAGGWAQFDAASARRRGVVVSALFPSRPVGSAFESGYAPTEVSGVVTRAAGRRVFEIDGLPAAEVYSAWSGIAPGSADQPTPILSESALAPLGLVAGSVASVPLHLLAHPAALNPDGSLDLFATLAPGERIWLMEGSRDSLVSRAGRVARHATLLRPDPGAPIAGALAIYCGGCMLAVRDRIPEVAADVARSLGGAPFLGVFTFGEQGALLAGPARHGNLMISCGVFTA